MQLSAFLIVFASFCFWSSLQLLLDSWLQEVAQVPLVPNNPRETPKAKSGTFRSVFLASNETKHAQVRWLNISVPAKVTDYKYSKKCDPRSGEFKNISTGHVTSFILLDTWVAKLRLAIVAAEYAYAFVCVPGLPVQLIDKWGESASKPLVGARTTIMGQGRDPVLKIAGPVLMDVLLPPRASDTSKAYLGVKLREPAKILDRIYMPWTSKTQFLIAIGQALQGSSSALTNGVISHWVPLFGSKNPFDEVLAATPNLKYRTTIWFPKYLLLTRLWIIYITIGALVGSKDLWGPLAAAWWGRALDNFGDNFSDWEPYPWGDWSAQILIKLVAFFRFLILLLACMILVSSLQETIGLVCCVGPPALVTLSVWLAVWDYEIVKRNHRRVLACILFLNLLGGTVISELGWRRLTPEIELCSFARMVIFPKVDLKSVDRFFIELLDSTSVLNYIFFIIVTVSGGLLAKCVLHGAKSLRLPSPLNANDLFHALWIIRSYNDLQKQEQQQLRRSMLCALGALWDRDLEDGKQKVEQIVMNPRTPPKEETLIKDVSEDVSKDGGGEMIRCGALLWWRCRLGKSAKDIRGSVTEATFSAKDFKDAGFSIKEIRDADFSATEFKEAGLVRELTKAGFTLNDLHSEAGFTPNDLYYAGFKASELRENRDYSALTLKEAGYSVYELKQGGFIAKDLHEAKFSVEDLKKAGFTAYELTQVLGHNKDIAKQLREVGFSREELEETGFNEKQLSFSDGIATFGTP